MKKLGHIWGYILFVAPMKLLKQKLEQMSPDGFRLLLLIIWIIGLSYWALIAQRYFLGG